MNFLGLPQRRHKQRIAKLRGLIAVSEVMEVVILANTSLTKAELYVMPWDEADALYRQFSP